MVQQNCFALFILSWKVIILPQEEENCNQNSTCTTAVFQSPFYYSLAIVIIHTQSLTLISYSSPFLLPVRVCVCVYVTFSVYSSKQKNTKLIVYNFLSFSLGLTTFLFCVSTPIIWGWGFTQVVFSFFVLFILPLLKTTKNETIPI